MNRRVLCALTVLVLATLAFALADTTKPANLTASLSSGKVSLKSAGALAFGPDGILFVGDSAGGAVVELDTNDRTQARSAAVNVEGIDTKIAAMAGVAPDQIAINDLKVNPISKN